MVRSIILTLLLAGTPLLAVPVDFSPHSEGYTLDGMQMKRTFFMQGDKRIGYDVPNGWGVNGAGSKLILTPPKAAQAQATIECIPLSAPEIYNEAHVKDLAEQAAAFIPAKAEKVTPVLTRLNDFRVEKHDVLEIVTAYSFYGQAFRIGVIYVNYGDNQLRCKIITHAADFDDLYAAFRGSLFSWATL